MHLSFENISTLESGTFLTRIRPCRGAARPGARLFCDKSMLAAPHLG